MADITEKLEAAREFGELGDQWIVVLNQSLTVVGSEPLLFQVINDQLLDDV